MRNNQIIGYLGTARSPHTLGLVTAFARKGWVVHLISFPPPPYPLEGVNVHSVSHSYFDRDRIPYFLLSVFKVRKVLKAISPDILHILGASDYGLWGSIGKVAPLVVRALGSDVLKSPFIRKNKLIKQKLIAPFWKVVIKFVLDRAEAIHIETRYDVRFIEKIFHIPSYKLYSIPHGVNMEIFGKEIPDEDARRWYRELSISPSQPIVLAPRMLRPHYRPEVILKSIPLVREKHPEVIYIFLIGFGEPFYMEYLKRISKEMGIEANTRFIEKLLPQKEIATLMHISNILVSIPESDSLSIAVLDGIVKGCLPVLTRDVFAYKELLAWGVKAFFVNGDSEKELADTISQLVENRAWLDKELVERNKRAVLENATFEKTVEMIEKVYKKVLARRH